MQTDAHPLKWYCNWQLLDINVRNLPCDSLDLNFANYGEVVCGPCLEALVHPYHSQLSP